MEELGYAEGVDAVYDASMPSGPALEIARSTQNGNLVEDPDWHTTGYNGSGVNVAVVEGERMWNANPYLAVTGTRDTSRAFKDHPTAVGGMIASTHGTVRGLAPGATMYSANGDDYATIAALEAAMDWAVAAPRQRDVMNHSFYADCGASTSLTTIDRHMDYLVRNLFKTAVVASGNFNDTTCGGNPVISVNAPGKGFNALTVGAFDDKNTPGWSDDTMAMNGAAVVWSQYNHDGRYKPEIAASGVAINSTTRTAPYTGDTGSGTSYASPMVAATAANIIDANPDLV